MLGSNLIARICIPKSSHGDSGRLLTYRKCLQLKQSRISRFSDFQCKTLNYMRFKQLSVNSLLSARKCCMLRCNSTQATVATKNKTDEQTETNFQQLMFARKEQAQRSILLCIPTKDDIPYAVAKCEQFGMIINAYSYCGEKNYFVLLEYSNENAARDLFNNCHYQQKNDIFPVFSRIIQFKEKSRASLPKLNIEIQEDSKTESSNKIGCSLSEVIEDVYCNEKLTELDMRLRYFFCTLAKDSASGLFPKCDVFPFGSSVNGIGRHGCDLDVIIKLHSEKVNDDGEFTFFNKTSTGGKIIQQKVVHLIGEYFRTCLLGITNMQKVLHCRVPIVKMHHKFLKLDCDISVNNMAGVLMSDVVHFCGEVDPRFRPLLYAVKKWAKESCITCDTPGAWITNFGLTNLLIYFFQIEQILPPLNDALVIIGDDGSSDFNLQYLKSNEEWKKFALQNKKSLAELLIGFFSFLAEYPFGQNILSLMGGKARPQPLDATALWIQFLFDEGLNVTKNVSEHEFSDLRNKAGIAVKCLESKLNVKTLCTRDFSLLLGIPSNVEDLKAKNFRWPEKVVNGNAYFKGHNNFKHTAKHITV